MEIMEIVFTAAQSHSTGNPKETKSGKKRKLPVEETRL